MHCTVVLLKAFFGNQLRSPKVWFFGVLTGVLEHAVTAFFSSFDGRVKMWPEGVHVVGA